MCELGEKLEGSWATSRCFDVKILPQPRSVEVERYNLGSSVLVLRDLVPALTDEALAGQMPLVAGDCPGCSPGPHVPAPHWGPPARRDIKAPPGLHRFRKVDWDQRVSLSATSSSP